MYRVHRLIIAVCARVVTLHSMRMIFTLMILSIRLIRATVAAPACDSMKTSTAIQYCEVWSSILAACYFLAIDLSNGKYDSV